jgi:single-strand DNA-binding protein
MNLNRVTLAGRLTRDVELKTTQGNNSVASFGLAVNRQWKDASGEKQEEVTYIDCTAWGKTAEAMAKFLAKGRPVYVEGRLKLDQWEDKDGGKRSKLSVVVESFQFIDNKQDGGTAPAPAPARTTNNRTPARSTITNHPPMTEEDIPFDVAR